MTYKKVTIETERCIIRDLEETDAEGMYELDSDPEVHEFLGKQPIQTIEEAKHNIALIRAQYVTNGIGRWAIIDKKTNDFIGWTGLKFEHGLRKEFDYYDLGYRLRKKYWGKGIATETANASLKYGFEQLKLEEIGAAADINHIASNTILRNLGLQYVDQFEYDGVPHNFYSLKKTEWTRMQGY
ncbi:GNAT family N-acetyltransferase [Aquimarina sp. 2-A2]|uniref:GNAT family N-acetyltransferase n=1 Tax=Aquimarina sp. 2-A2 TaxID=3382644 RepID=UPI00387F2883